MSAVQLTGQSLPGQKLEELVLEIDGKKISGWTDVHVTRSMERVVSSFECTLTERYPGAADVLIKPGAPCRVLLGDDLVLTGYVDRFTPEFDPHSHRVTVSGRGKLQDMVDCSADWPGSQFSNETLGTLAEKLLKLHDIAVIVLTDTGATLPQVIVNVGDSVFDVLEPIARYRALLMYEDVGGDLIFSKVGSAKAANGFKEGENVESAGIAYAMDQRFSLYSAYRTKFAAFKDSGQEANLIADVQDPGVPRYRPKFFVAETNDGGFDVAQRRAIWEALSSSSTIRCSSWTSSSSTASGILRRACATMRVAGSKAQRGNTHAVCVASQWCMDQLEQARLMWQSAQAEVQTAMGGLEKCVADLADARAVEEARKNLTAKQKTAEDLLQRYITQLGKS